MIEVWNISCDWLCPFHPQRILIGNLIPQVWNISCDWLRAFHPQRILIDNLTPCGSGYPSHAPIGSPWMHKPNVVCLNSIFFQVSSFQANLLFSCHLLNNTQGPITSRHMPYGHHTYGKNVQVAILGYGLCTWRCIVGAKLLGLVYSKCLGHSLWNLMVPLFLDEIMTKPINHVVQVFVPNVRCKSMFGGSHWDLQCLDPFSNWFSHTNWLVSNLVIISLRIGLMDPTQWKLGYWKSIF